MLLCQVWLLTVDGESAHCQALVRKRQQGRGSAEAPGKGRSGKPPGEDPGAEKSLGVTLVLFLPVLPQVSHRARHRGRSGE